MRQFPEWGGRSVEDSLSSRLPLWRCQGRMQPTILKVFDGEETLLCDESAYRKSGHQFHISIFQYKEACNSQGRQAKRQERNTTLQEMSESVMTGEPSSEAGKGGPPFPLIELPLGDFSSFYYRIQVAMANAHVSF